MWVCRLHRKPILCTDCPSNNSLFCFKIVPVLIPLRYNWTLWKGTFFLGHSINILFSLPCTSKCSHRPLHTAGWEHPHIQSEAHLCIVGLAHWCTSAEVPWHTVVLEWYGTPALAQGYIVALAHLCTLPLAHWHSFVLAHLRKTDEEQHGTVAQEHCGTVVLAQICMIVLAQFYIVV